MSEQHDGVMKKPTRFPMWRYGSVYASDWDVVLAAVLIGVVLIGMVWWLAK